MGAGQDGTRRDGTGRRGAPGCAGERHAEDYSRSRLSLGSPRTKEPLIRSLAAAAAAAADAAAAATVCGIDHPSRSARGASSPWQHRTYTAATVYATAAVATSTATATVTTTSTATIRRSAVSPTGCLESSARHQCRPIKATHKSARGAAPGGWPVLRRPIYSRPSQQTLQTTAP